MEIKDVAESVRKVKESSTKRKFNQTFDLIITLKDLNLKKPEEQVDFFGTLHHTRGKQVKVAALVGPEMIKQAKEACDLAISAEDFDDYAKDKKKTKKLAREYDFFIAQATIMPKVATAFGKVLGPKGKMPNPKAGCVVPPNANLKMVTEKLRNTARISAKTSPMIQAGVGKEDMKEEEIADNIKTVYDQLIHHLPNERNNIQRIILKLTMGKPFKLDERGAIIEKAAIEKKSE